MAVLRIVANQAAPDPADAAHRAIAAAAEIVYPLTDEPWGVRRFFVRDPLGRLLNVLSHESRSEPSARSA